MSSSKRPAKRSIVGVRVAVRRDAGFYEPATIVDMTSKQLSGPAPGPGDKFLLKFDDGYSQWFPERHIIGQGFQNVTSACLSVGQIVYCTVQHRETPARIVQLPCASPSIPGSSELFLLETDDASARRVRMRQEDLRLIKSRKSARITADKDKDYHSLALGKQDLLPEALPEPPLSAVNYPSSNISSGRRRHPAGTAMPLQMALAGIPRALPLYREGIFQSDPLEDHMEAEREEEEEDVEVEDDDSDESNHGPAGGEMELNESDMEKRNEDGDVLMDECSAALVLMSLGGSSPHGIPAAVKIPHLDNNEDAGFLSASCPSVTSGSGASYGSWPGFSSATANLPARPSRLQGLRSRRPDSPANLQEDSCTSSSTATFSSDEGIELASSGFKSDAGNLKLNLDHDYVGGWPSENNRLAVRKRRPSGNVVYQCTFPKCQHMESTRSGIKKHIQTMHLISSSLPTEELEFYYNELDGRESPSPLPSPSASATSSWSRGFSKDSGVSSTRRQRSSLSASSETTSASTAASNNRLMHSRAKPINIPRLSKRRDYDHHSASAPMASLRESPNMSSNLPFTPSASKVSKGREVKKCRKVYGMDNREMWCTQCKWKKACSRFAE